MAGEGALHQELNEAVDDNPSVDMDGESPPIGNYTPVLGFPNASPIPLSKDVIAALEGGQSMSENAEADYERLVTTVRGLGRPPVVEVSRAIVALPIGAHEFQRNLMSLLGQIGSLPEDSALLATFAARPMFTGEEASLSEAMRFEAEETRITIWHAAVSLVGLVDRTVDGAVKSARGLLRTADRHIAFFIGMELQRRDLFSMEDRAILELRGINPEYKSIPMERLDVTPIVENATVPPAR
jgi:hypothetical protein